MLEQPPSEQAIPPTIPDDEAAKMRLRTLGHILELLPPIDFKQSDEGGFSLDDNRILITDEPDSARTEEGWREVSELPPGWDRKFFTADLGIPKTRAAALAHVAILGATSTKELSVTMDKLVDGMSPRIVASALPDPGSNFDDQGCLTIYRAFSERDETGSSAGVLNGKLTRKIRQSGKDYMGSLIAMDEVGLLDWRRLTDVDILLHHPDITKRFVGKLDQASTTGELEQFIGHLQTGLSYYTQNFVNWLVQKIIVDERERKNSIKSGALQANDYATRVETAVQLQSSLREISVFDSRGFDWHKFVGLANQFNEHQNRARKRQGRPTVAHLPTEGDIRAVVPNALTRLVGWSPRNKKEAQDLRHIFKYFEYAVMADFSQPKDDQ